MSCNSLCPWAKSSAVSGRLCQCQRLDESICRCIHFLLLLSVWCERTLQECSDQCRTTSLKSIVENKITAAVYVVIVCLGILDRLSQYNVQISSKSVKGALMLEKERILTDYLYDYMKSSLNIQIPNCDSVILYITCFEICVVPCYFIIIVG